MRIFSGVQPTGTLHLGNLLGSINQWVTFLKQQPEEATAIFSVVDLHAITVPQDPQVLAENNLKVAATYIAAGINPDKHMVFIQSQNPDHAQLAWIFNCVTPLGWLQRMTQYKDKKQKMKNFNESVSTGLLTYPTLMAADILLYDTDVVPVGIDQKQHVELAADIARRFNSKFGNTFTVPKVRINKVTAKIFDLQEPTKKMSKSDASVKGRIEIMDTPEEIRSKISRAVTDPGREVKFDSKNKPGISNLLSIFSAVTEQSVEELEDKYAESSYADFKNDVAEAVIEFLSPLQKRITELLDDKAELIKILDKGAERTQDITHPKLLEVAKKVGLYQHS